MNLRRILLAVIVLELAIGGFKLWSRHQAPKGVAVNGEMVNPVTAADLTEMAEKARTPEEWRTLGESLMAAGYYAESEMAHRTACDMAPANPTYRFQWAFALERLALLNEANEQYRQAISLKYAKPDAARYYIGRNFLRMEKVPEAVGAYEEGRGLPACQYELARLANRAGDLAKANELLDGLLRTHGQFIEPNLLRYRMAADRGDKREMFRWADRVRHAKGRLPNPFEDDFTRVTDRTIVLGDTARWKTAAKLMQEEKTEEAERLIRQTLELEWQFDGADLLAELEQKKGNHAEAIRILEDALARNGPSGQLLGRLGYTWMIAGQPAKAMPYWKRALPMFPPSDRDVLAQAAAETAVSFGDRETARMFETEVIFATGLKRLTDSRFREAAASFEEVAKREPANAEAWFQLGEARRLGGNIAGAIAAYQKCLETSPGHGRAADTLEYLDGK
ncbi:tetratricopeptide repeat protein [Zavarzinella formosa]|uniref:tetratricopeptide repeat protein n=1 Tax=Zavarzinella formosa TaxID=360055 RepID=UPI000305EF32|nr:tetratricopeptide repeat protein [Zavarzinella formosa]